MDELYYLLMADNTLVRVSMAGVGQQGDLWIHVHEKSMAECISIFMDRQKTSVMRIDFDQTIEEVFTGYTELFSISVCDGFIKVGLGKGNENA